AGPPAPTRRNRPGSRAASSARRRRRRVRRPPARTPEDRAGTGCAARRRTTPQRSRAFEHSSVPLYELVDTVHVSEISGQRPLGSLSDMTAEVGRRRPRGAVRDGLVAAGLELARTGGPDAVLLREATRLVGVVPNAAYRHFADRDELLAAVCAAAMDELTDRMAAGVARIRGKHGDPAAARRRLGAIGTAYLQFAHAEPGLFATAFALPEQHDYAASG